MEETKKRVRGPDKKKRKSRKQDYKAVVCVEDNLLFYNAEDAGKYYSLTADYVRKICRGERFPPADCKHFEYYENFREQQELEQVEKVNWEKWYHEYAKLSKEEGFKAWCRLQFLEAVRRAKKGE